MFIDLLNRDVPVDAGSQGLALPLCPVPEALLGSAPNSPGRSHLNETTETGDDETSIRFREPSMSSYQAGLSYIRSVDHLPPKLSRGPSSRLARPFILDTVDSITRARNFKMSVDQHGEPAGDGLPPTKGTSKHGKAFEFRTMPSASDDEPSTVRETNEEQANFSAMETESADGLCLVHWVPVKGHWLSVPWTQTSPEIQNLGISQYKLYYHGKGASDDYFRYRLWFTNTKGWGFAFTDDSNDTYTCKTVWNRDHCIDYDSDNPTIKLVTTST